LGALKRLELRRTIWHRAARDRNRITRCREVEAIREAGRKVRARKRKGERAAVIRKAVREYMH
jgi:hypothetical protein